MADIPQNFTKLIAVYARVSTAKQEEDGTIETQLSAVRDFARKNNLTIVKEYIDEGWSGDILARPQLDQLRQDVKSKLWEAVLIYDPDRLARRYSYQELVMDELREAGIEVIFVTTPAPKNGEEKILHGVKGLFAEYERAKISERFRLGKLRKVKEGHLLVTEAPYGYNYIPKRDKVHGYYEVNEEEAKVVKMIFDFIVHDRLTVRGVVRKLQELKIAPKKSKRGVWSTSTLTTLLRNKTYIGEAYYGKSYAVVPENPLKTEKYKKMRKTSRKMKPEAEWIKIPVQGIIDPDLFARAGQQLKDNFDFSWKNKKNEYLLGGKIYCICGMRRTGEGPQRGGKLHLYYRCNARVNNFPLPVKCAEGGVNARIADALVWQRIAKLMGSPELLKAQMNRWLKQRRDNRQGSGVVIEDMREDVVKLKIQEDRYNKAYGAGLFPIEKLKEYIVPIRERVAVMEGSIMMAEAERGGLNEATLPNMHEVEEYTTRAAITLKSLNFEARRAIVRNVIEKVVGSKNECRVYGYIPLTTENHVKFKTIHRYRGAA